MRLLNKQEVLIKSNKKLMLTYFVETLNNFAPTVSKEIKKHVNSKNTIVKLRL
jgi:hypothetical protein